MKRFGIVLLAALMGSFITLITSRWLDHPTVRIEHVDGSTPIKIVSQTSDSFLDFTGTAEKVLPAVVHIKSTGDSEIKGNVPNQIPDAFHFFFEDQVPQRRSQSSGSGVIINPNGYIITNNHVVDGAEIVEVSLWDNSEVKAEVIGTDPDTDLAVLKINRKDLPYLAFVDSDKCKVGEWVLAVGNPFNLNSTVTAGIISAKGRNINIIRSGNPASGSTAIESFIQTDAAINPGNSGGALVNLNGGLIGINTAIASPTGSYSGYGFAIPSDLVSKVVEDIISYGAVQRGWLGIQIQSVTPELVKEKDLKVNEGAYVIDFPEKSAAKSGGINKGDVVTKIDDTPIKSNTELISYIGRHRPGDKVKVWVNRSGKMYSYDVVLKNKEGNLEKVTPSSNENAMASLGIELADMNPSELRKFDLESGVRIKRITNGKVKRYTDMREGFIITHIDNKRIKGAEEVTDIINKKKAGEQIIFSGQYENFPREYLYAMRM